MEGWVQFIIVMWYTLKGMGLAISMYDKEADRLGIPLALFWLPLRWLFWPLYDGSFSFLSIYYQNKGDRNGSR